MNDIEGNEAVFLMDSKQCWDTIPVLEGRGKFKNPASQT